MDVDAVSVKLRFRREDNGVTNLDAVFFMLEAPTIHFIGIADKSVFVKIS